MTLRINCWSGPRNISTALMRSFSQRADTVVVDEPLYGHYLAVSGAPHPAREELLQSLDTDPRRIVSEVILGPCARDVLFMKQMVHHLTPDLDLGFLDHCVNVQLIRDPAEVIASLVHQLPKPTMRDVGLERQAELFADLRAGGQEPPVVDAGHLLRDPPHVLGSCATRSGSSGIRPCCRGRPALIPRTAPGGRTGTSGCGALRGSRPIDRGPPRCPTTAAPFSRSAGPTTRS